MQNNCAAFFRNTDCEYFPCHAEPEAEEFNCLFCYCPLYSMGERCGGNFSYSEKGVKNCASCSLPHRRDGYEHVISRLREANTIE